MECGARGSAVRRVEQLLEALGERLLESRDPGSVDETDGGEVFAADELIDILRVADSGFVYGGDPAATAFSPTTS